jgi:hypothetical protein
VTQIEVQAKPRNLGYMPRIDYNLRVRLVYDSLGKNALPTTVKWVKNSIINMLEYNDISSNDAESDLRAWRAAPRAAG